MASEEGRTADDGRFGRSETARGTRDVLVSQSDVGWWWRGEAKAAVRAAALRLLASEKAAAATARSITHHDDLATAAMVSNECCKGK